MKALLPNTRLDQHTPDSRSAFTLTELLVIVVVLFFLAATLATGLATTRPDTLTAQCLNNLRQLGLGWRMYSEDYQGWLVYNRDGGNAGKAPSDASWAGGWLDFTSSSDNTNIDLLISHSKYPYGAFFGPYLRTASVFKCPADKSVAPGGFPRARTVSMNNLVGQLARSWTAPSAYMLYNKANQLGNPARLFVLLDEREDSINDPLFFSDPDSGTLMVDYPADYHDGGGNFVFADGHGETHLWKDPRTTPPIRPGQLIPLVVPMAGNADLLWLQQHASEPR